MPRVLAAMSGGVDSSVAAFLLKEAGLEVIGATMKLSPPCHSSNKSQEYVACCSEDAVYEARRVAHHIGIRHYVLNLRQIFEKKVIEDFYKEYRKGRTPNPCIRCNQFIKFDALLKKAKELGTDYICTGHYAKIQYNKGKEKFFLKKAKDKNKDQSYFLYAIKKRNLKHILFPLGDLKKEEVRRIAKKAGFNNYARTDSQELCFAAQNDYRKFINKFLKPKKGKIINRKGEVLGEHQGVFYYTIGQRKGLGLAAPRPYYVIDINWRKNEVIVGFEEELYVRSLIAKNLNFIGIDKLTRPLKIKAKTRYRHPAQQATISKLANNKVKVEFFKPQRAITPGQAVVFYQKDLVVGGGVIDKKIRKD